MKSNYNRSFFFFFILFGTIVMLLTAGIDGWYRSRVHTVYLKNAWKGELEIKRQFLAETIHSAENSVQNIRENPLLFSWLEDPDEQNLTAAQDLFHAVSAENPSYMQIRFLDQEGKEKIRAARHQIGGTPFIVSKENLQDKSTHDCFRNTINLAEKTFRVSPLGFSKDDTPTEVPAHATLHISSPVVHNGKTRGILIIDVFAKNFLQKILHSNRFHTALVEGDGTCLFFPCADENWSTIRQSDKNILDKYRGRLDLSKPESISGDGVFQTSVSREFPTGQDVRIVFIEKRNLHADIKKLIYRLLTIFVSVALLSLPAGLYLSGLPFRLQRKLKGRNQLISSWANIVQQNMMYVVVDREDRIHGASPAFLKKTGFKIKELKSSIWHDFLVSDDSPVFTEGKQVEVKIKTAEDGSFWANCTAAELPGKKDIREKKIIIIRNIDEQKQAEKRSLTDGLTRLANRKALNEFLAGRRNMAIRYKLPFTVVFFDLDHFKRVNDTFGHLAGDTVLVEIADILRSHVRRNDLAGRFGGEEFLLVLPQTSIDGAMALAENLRLQIQLHQFSAGCSITASFGVAIFQGDESVEELLQRVDTALYEAKHSGRNAVKKA